MRRLAYGCMTLSCMHSLDIKTDLESHTPELLLALLAVPSPQDPKVNVQFDRPRIAHLDPRNVHSGCDGAQP